MMTYKITTTMTMEMEMTMAMMMEMTMTMMTMTMKVTCKRELPELPPRSPQLPGRYHC